MKMHFISGLPRSGSTLLAAILRQNPRFQASIMTPVGSIFTSMLTQMTPKTNEAGGFLTDANRHAMLTGMIEGYYYDVSADSVVFDNNRRWTANINHLAGLYPDAQILCCVRDPIEIVDSFERLFQRNPMHVSAVHGGVANTTVYQRAGEMLAPEGVIGYSLDATRSAFFGPRADKMLMIEYAQLAQYPKETIADVYIALGEEPFEHDFTRIEPIPGTAEFDMTLDTPGLHGLKPTVSYEPRQTILPPEIVKAVPAAFWRGCRDV